MNFFLGTQSNEDVPVASGQEGKEDEDSADDGDQDHDEVGSGKGFLVRSCN